MKEFKKLRAGLILALAFMILRSAAAEDNAATNHHSLWRVEGRSNVVYVLGSIHLLKPDNYPLPQPLENAFTNSQIAVFETEIYKMHEPEIQGKMITQGSLPEGETLKQQLSEETYAAFSKQMAESGLPAGALDKFKPFMAALVLSALELQKLGLDPDSGVDQYFFDRAGKEGKQTVALEPIDFQLGLVTGFSKEEGELVMKSTLKDIDKTKAKFAEMVSAWQTGDSAKLEGLLNEMKLDAPGIFKRLVTDRSKNWMPKIEELLHGDKNAVVIVGTGHLVGSEGVIEMLKAKGLKVTQL